MNFIKRAWRGEEKLWKVFLLPLLLFFFLSALLNPIKSLYIGTVFQYIFQFLLVSYTIWYIVSLWRCAFNTQRKMYSYIARLFALNLAGILFGMEFYFFLALSGYSSI